MTNFFTNILSWLIDVSMSFGLKLLAAGVVLLVGHLLIRLVVHLLQNGKRFSKVDPTARTFINSFVKIALWIILLVCIIAILGVPMASVIAAIASCGVAIGLALQGSLSNFAGGIMILLFRPFKVGDFVETGASSGTVVEVGIFYTVLLTPDNKHITIPNGSMMNNTVTNYSIEENRRVDIDFAIAYEADADRACAIALEVARAHSLVLADPEPFARVTALGESGCTVTLRAWAKGDNFWDVKFDLLSSVRAALEAENIRAPYPRMNVSVSRDDQ